MKATDIVRYPKFAHYVKHDLPHVLYVPAIVAAVKKFGQLDRKRLQRALAWGFNPDISIVFLSGANGAFTPNVGSNEIRIDRKIVEEFEVGLGVRAASAGNVYLVGTTILHELCHWGDDKDGIDHPLEEGVEFEKAVYGSDID